ncbi:MAG TPA: ABC transporter ATP-binding protein [Candidatus Thermoplasmatota archaeon]|nr:ABC transporter ATP-binding protein [Candidatus Thermoplasmatota archaeon]
MTSVIEARGLTKVYPKGARGVEDVTFDVRKGEVFGFLGPNGAGKTTTMRLLLDLLRPTRGEARLFGLDARLGREEIHARMGYLPGELPPEGRMTAREQAEFLGSLRGGVDPARVEALAARLHLDLDRPVRALSRGNRQKVGLLQAFMHDPELLVLDEPTSGLDPLMQHEFNALVREARAAGRTVFLSSHILPEVEALCDRVGVIREGRLVAVTGVGDLKARAVRRVQARFRSPPRAAWLDGVPGAADVRVEGDALAFTVRGPLGDAVRALAREDLVDLAAHEPSLEDVFMAMYAEEAPR